MDQKKYTEDGFLFVSELERCPYFEKTPSTYQVCGNEDCFYCKFSDFRKMEYIKQLEESLLKGPLHSICHNEKNNLQYKSRREDV